MEQFKNNPPQVQINQVFNNYTELCNHLNLPILGGKSKQLQLKKLEQYFSWTRDGKKYIVTEVFTTPHSIVEIRGKNKPLARYQYLFNTILLMQLIFGGDRDEDNMNCVSFTKTELRQGLFKLINRDYYNIRKDVKRASKETGLSEELLKFGDRKVTDKISSMSFRGFEQLKENGKIDVTNGIYIYYIDLKEYFNTGEKIVRCRAASDAERNLILSAGWIGEKEYENEFREMSGEEKMNPENYRGVRSKKILKNKLEILNGVKYVEDVMDKIMADGEMMEGEVNGDADAVTPINIDELMDLRIQEVMKGEGKKIVPLNDEQLEVLKKSDGLNAYAIEKGEFWVNIVEKIKFLLLTPNILKMELIERLGELKSMPGAQEELNVFMLDWIEDKATNVWGGFSQKFLNESATGSRDIVKDMMIFAGRYVDVKRVEKNYEWKEYQDEAGKIWKVRYSNNKMKFDEANLKNVVFDSGEEEGEEGKRVILWNAPHKEELCTNCGELVEMARRIWSQKDWMPIEGYLGGIWDEDKGKEIGCVVLKLGEFGILVLKRQWNMK